MTRLHAIVFLVAGLLVSATSTLLAIQFFSFPVLPSVTIPRWDGVAVFSVLALGGLISAIAGVRHLMHHNRSDEALHGLNEG